MNKINDFLSDSHLDLNAVICALHSKINDEQLGDDFDSAYAICCLSNIRSALIESAVLIYHKLPEEQRFDYLKKLFSFGVITLDEFNYIKNYKR